VTELDLVEWYEPVSLNSPDQSTTSREKIAAGRLTSDTIEEAQCHCCGRVMYGRMMGEGAADTGCGEQSDGFEVGGF
jgi:hypothetical protein